jgi:hypothetical protein
MDWNNIFDYNEETGELIWKIKTAIRITIGDMAGRLNSGGYLQVGLYRKYYVVHRVVWEMHYGEIPTDYVIDHIDGDKTNNRLSNLRICTHTENLFNSKLSKDNSTGFKGVTYDSRRIKRPYRACINIDGKKFSLGHFATAEEASEAFNEIAKELHGEFYREI